MVCWVDSLYSFSIKISEQHVQCAAACTHMGVFVSHCSTNCLQATGTTVASFPEENIDICLCPSRIKLKVGLDVHHGLSSHKHSLLPAAGVVTAKG